MQSISISIVLYKPEMSLFISVLENLAIAVDRLQKEYKVLLIVLDNSADKKPTDLEKIIQKIWSQPFHFIQAPKNLGFAKGHNQAIKASQCDYHLILNPDVIIDPLALSKGLAYLQAHSDTVLVSPYACSENGKRQYLCKSYPSLFDLFLRGFTPVYCQRLFIQRLANYELKGQTEASELVSVPIVSGCFMLLRKSDFDQVNGFSEKFFLYFEDFDLSIKLQKLGNLSYLPEVKIVHFGGQAAKKGVWHIFLFVRSMCFFFNRHGWQWY